MSSLGGSHTLLESTVSDLRKSTNDKLESPVSSNKSSRLHYQLYGSVSAQLEIDWEVFSGFTLNDVKLHVEGFYESGGDKSLSVHLEASCTIGDYLLKVEGDLPDLGTEKDVDFVLTLTVKNRYSVISPQDLAIGLSGKGDKHGFDFSKVTGSLDEGLRKKLTSPGHGFALKTSITITRSSKGDYFVRDISLIVQAQTNWSPVKHLNLTDIGLFVRVYREGNTTEDSWKYDLSLKARMLVNETPVSVLVKIEIGNVSRAELTVTADPWSGLTAHTFLSELVADASSKTIETHGPPSLPGSDHLTKSTASPLSASIVISKTNASGWAITSVDLIVAMPGFHWSPIKNHPVSLQDLRFELHVAKKTTEVTGSAGSWDFSGAVGATLSMRKGHFLIPVSISYDSTTTVTEIKGTLPDGIYGQLDAIAMDPCINPKEGGFMKLTESANKSPAPESSPLQLTKISSGYSGKERGLLLRFNKTTLTRARFHAEFAGENWKVTDHLTITNLGVMFDIENPRDSKTRSISGYVFGKAKLGKGTELFAFVAGVSDPKHHEFWMGFSIEHDPNGTLGTTPTDLISDGQFSGKDVGSVVAGAPDAESWNVDFPVGPDTVLKSLKAKLLVKFLKVKAHGSTGGGSPEQTSKTTLSQIKVHLAAEGTWEIWDGLSLVDLHLNVLADRRPEGGYDWSVDLYGKIVKNTYQVEFVANIKHHSQTTEFEVQVKLKEKDTNKAVSPTLDLVAGISVFGDVKPDGEELNKDSPFQPQALISNVGEGVSVSCYALAERAKDKSTDKAKYSFKTLRFQLDGKKSWNIAPSIVLKNATLQLVIENLGAKEKPRKFVLTASGSVTIGTLEILASVGLEKGKLQVMLQISTGNTRKVLESLLGGDNSRSFPDGSPLGHDQGSSLVYLDVCCTPGNDSGGSGSWGISTLELSIPTPWNIGHLKVNSIIFHADLKKDKKISFMGKLSIGGVAIGVEVVAKDKEITITLQAAKVGDIVSTVTASDQSHVLDKLTPPTESGVSQYQTAHATATVVFKNRTFESLAICVSAPLTDVWTLIPNTLALKSLQAKLNITKSTGKDLKFDLVIHADLSVTRSTGKVSIIPVDLTVTSKYLHLVITSLDCDLTEVVYLVTEGKCTLGFALGPTLKTFDLKLDWSNKTGVLDLKFQDWTLPDGVLSDVVAMKDPGILMTVKSRAVTGTLHGKAKLGPLKVDLTYDLPKGPFRINGVDVKKWAEVTRNLLRAGRTAAEVAEAMAAVAEGAEAGAAVGGALLAAGFAESLVKSLISQFFGNKKKNNHNDEPKPTPDRPNPKPKPKTEPKQPPPPPPPPLQWVVHGAGRSNGVIGEEVVLLIYQKNSTAPAIDLANLSVSISRKGKVLSVTKKFKRIDLGWSCIYTRPSEPGEYTIFLEYHGTSLTVDEFPCQAMDAIGENQSIPDIRRCVAYGKGLCSGTAGEKTHFTVRIRDELGGDVSSTNNVSCEVFMFSDASTGDVKLAFTSPTIISGAFDFSYTRPTGVSEYTLSIFVNHQYLNGSPVRVKITSQPAMPSITNSRFNITGTTAPYFVDTNLIGLITMMDGDGNRWMEGEVVGLKGTMILGASGTETPLVLVNLLDGTYSINLRFEQSGLWNIVLTCGQSTSDPMTSEYQFTVLPTPTLVGVRCFGPGLSPGLGSEPTFFNIQGYDQSGSRIAVDQTDFKVVLQHGTPPSLSIHDTMVRVSYNRPTSTNAYNIVSVLWKEVHLDSSPFLVSNIPILRATSPAKSIVQSETYRIGESSTAIVFAVDLDGWRRFVGEDNVAATLNQQKLEVIDRQDGTYAVKYVPLNTNCNLDITINDTALPRFSPESPVLVPSVHGEVNPTAKVGIQATFDIDGVHVDQKTYNGRLVFIMTDIVVEVVNVDISATTDSGSRRATYTISNHMKVGTYRCKLFILGVPEPAVSLFMIDVSIPPTTEPETIEPETIEPETIEPETIEPKPKPSVPEPVEPNPIEPKPETTGPKPVEPKPTEPKPAEPKPIEPGPVEPKPTEPKPTEPKPETTEPNTTKPNTTEPTIDPKIMEPEPEIKRPVSPNHPLVSDPSTIIVHHRWNDLVLWHMLDSHGINASFKDGLFEFHNMPGDYQGVRGAEVTLRPPPGTTGGGFIVSYDVRWVNMAYDSVALMDFPVWPFDGVIPQLRFNNGKGSWGILDSFTQEFTDLGKSSMAADGVWHTVLYHYAPASVTVFEDGDLVFTQYFGQSPLGPVVKPLSIMMTSFDHKSIFHAEVRNVVIIATVFNIDPSSPRSTEQVTDIAFTTTHQKESRRLWPVVADMTGPVAARYTSGSLQFYIPGTTNRFPMWLKSQSGADLDLRHSVAQYRFKVETAQCSDIRITMMGNVILRFDDGVSGWWYELEPNAYQYLAPSKVSAEYVVVTVITNKKSITYFENGLLLFSRSYTSEGGPPRATFNVALLGPSNSSTVDLSNFRGIPAQQ